MLRVYYSPAYVGADHDFDTTRKARWVAESLARSPIVGVELREPRSLTAEQVEVVHSAEYVTAVRTGEPRALAESQYFTWDKGLWPMVLASNGGAVDAALAALEEGVAGSLSSGLHHARRDEGAGFCTFNGLALAARAALERGAKRVLILDLDAHCGGGTASLIADEERIWQLDVSVNGLDAYESTKRVRLERVSAAGDYLETIRRGLQNFVRDGIQFDLCLYNAGMDPFENCGIGGLAGISRGMLAERESIVFDWCRNAETPIAFVLAGGYVSAGFSQADLVDLHRETLARAASHSRA